MKIEEMCLEERPREKLKRMGVRAMSNGELLAVLLRVGVPGINVTEVAQMLLKSAGGRLSVLSGMSAEKLCEIPGIGPDKAATVCAAFELARRWFSETSGIAKVPIVSAEMAWRLVSPRLRGLDHEEFWVLFLNKSNYLLGIEQICSGNVSSTSVDIPRILKKALEKNATAVIMFHNHPSGNPRPGETDITTTASLKNALEAIGKQLLDHIIVADTSYYTFSEENVVRAPCEALLSEC